MNTISAFFISLSLFTALSFASAKAAPVSDQDRLAIDLRRTTLVVNNIEKSLDFYRDSLGMKVIYDKLINNPRDASVENAELARRLVFLRANDDYIGIIGLLEYIKPRKPKVDLKNKSFNEGTAVLVFNSTDLDRAFAKASEVPGVVILNKPTLVEYPSYSGTGTISVKVSVMQDPDGFTVELNELQEALH